MGRLTLAVGALCLIKNIARAAAVIFNSLNI